MAARNTPILGRWRIVEMEAWDQDYVGEEAKAYIQFDPKGGGEFHFGYVTGGIDYRLVEREGRPAAEWSWEGNAEMDPVSGRGWAVLGEDGKLRGRIFVHDGDDSASTAKRLGGPKERKPAWTGSRGPTLT